MKNSFYAATAAAAATTYARSLRSSSSIDNSEEGAHIRRRGTNCCCRRCCYCYERYKMRARRKNKRALKEVVQLDKKSVAVKRYCCSCSCCRQCSCSACVKEKYGRGVGLNHVFLQECLINCLSSASVRWTDVIIIFVALANGKIIIFLRGNFVIFTGDSCTSSAVKMFIRLSRIRALGVLRPPPINRYSINCSNKIF